MERGYREIYLRVVVPLAGLIVLSSIDRVNVSFAAAPMSADIGLDPAVYGFGVGLFFVAYLLFQIPSADVLRRIGARRWIGGSVIAWGLVGMAMGLIRRPGHFYALRVLLGLFESGFAPGVVWYVSQWLPQAHRARAVGLTLLAIPVSVVIGGPLCGALLSVRGATAAWRLMFVVEGAATLLAGIAALFWFVDRPDDARWLSPDVRRALGDALAVERTRGAAPAASPLGAALRDPILWLSALVWFVLITGSNAIIFWLPIAMRTLGLKDPLEIGVLSALPWVAIGLGMLLNARHSDRSGERYWHIALPMLWASLALGGAALAIGNGALALGLLVLGSLGIGGAQAVFWAVPTRFFAGSHPAALAIINLCGNVSGAVAPVAIGMLVARTGAIAVPVHVLAALLLLGAGVVLPLRREGEGRGRLVPGRA